MRFELTIIIHACISGCETFALSYFFSRFLARKHKARFVYILLYLFYFAINLSLVLIVKNVWVRGIFGILFPFAASLLMYSGKIAKRVFFAELILIFNLMAEPFITVLIAWLTGHVFPEVPAGDLMYFVAAGACTILYLLAIGIVTYLGKPETETTAITTRQYVVLCVMIGLCLFISYIDLLLIFRSGITIVFIHVVLELCIYSLPIFVFVVLRRFQDHAYIETRAKILQSQLSQNEKQFELMEAHQAEFRKQKHDFVGQLMMMEVMTKNLSNPELNDYLNNYKESAGVILEKTITGLTSIDTVVAIKKNLAERQKITFELHVPTISEIVINPVHLNNILINALDNAIEACVALPDGRQKHIELGLKTEGGYLFIKVTNTSLPVLVESDRFPETTKKDKASHGIGLVSISESVRKYNGIMSIDYSDGIFKLLIRMNNHILDDPLASC